MACWILGLVVVIGAVTAVPQRIVGGDPTTVEKYPAIVQVEIFNRWTGLWSHWCGGNILTSRSILSAAHCFVGSTYSQHFRRIRAGATYKGVGGQVSYVLTAYNHPTYNQATFMDGDISVVRLVTPLVYSPVVAQTSIPPQGTLIPDNLPTVHAGWGDITVDGPASDVLLDVTVYTVNNGLCRELYKNSTLITENMICVGILGIGGKDACSGDSGGPLYFGNITIGIVSFGVDCARGDFPGVNTAVAVYSDWVVENTI